MNIIKEFRQYIIGILILIMLYLLSGYFKDKLIVMLGGYTTQTTTTVIDSTFIRGKIDTMAVFNKYVETEGIILNPKPEIVYIDRTPDIIEDKEIDTLKQFTVSITDTLINGTATVLNDFKGNLFRLKLNYKPLFPKYIKRTDTIIVTNTVTKVLTNERSLLGVGVGYNNLQYLSILGSYTTKKKWQFMFEYGKALGNTIDIVEGVPFQLHDDDIYSIKVIKNF